MPKHISKPTRIEAAGNKPKLIDEYVGRVTTKSDGVSVAHMRSPGGWVEPGQRPEFTEHTIVLKGMLRVEHEGGVIDVNAGRLHVNRASGFDTARQTRMARSTSQSACRRFRQLP